MKKIFYLLILLGFIFVVPNLNASRVECNYEVKNPKDMYYFNFDLIYLDGEVTFKQKNGTETGNGVKDIKFIASSKPASLFLDVSDGKRNAVCPDIYITFSNISEGSKAQAQKSLTVNFYNESVNPSGMANVYFSLNVKKNNNIIEAKIKKTKNRVLVDDFEKIDADGNIDTGVFWCVYVDDDKNNLFAIRYSKSEDKLIIENRRTQVYDEVKFAPACLHDDTFCFNKDDFKNEKCLPSSKVFYSSITQSGKKTLHVSPKETSGTKNPKGVNIIDADDPTKPSDGGKIIGSGEILSPGMIKILNEVYRAIKIVSTLIAAALSMFEFAKIMSSEDKDGLKKAFKHLVIRVVIIILIFLLPTLVNLIGNLTGVGTLPSGLF